MSNKVPSPLLGYNNNVRHKGKVFHIQTEDSGVKYGHIITHLFMDGGRILKSVKTSYSEYIGNERMGDIVREMMKQQHKAMFIALRDGKFDSIAEGAADASQATRALAADAPPSQAQPAAQRDVALPPVPAAGQPAGAPVVIPPTVPAPPPAAARAAADDQPDGPPTIRQAVPAELALDIDALERAAVTNAASPVLRTASDLPPPPSNLFREKNASGKYRITPMPPAASVAAEGAAGTARSLAGWAGCRASVVADRRCLGQHRRTPLRAHAAGGHLRPSSTAAGQVDLR